MSIALAWNLLMSGDEAVAFKPRGRSMEPLVMDGQPVTIRRLADDNELAVGDIVLAKVHGQVYLHKITAIDGDRVQISNNRGHVNGWTHRDKVAGKLDD